MFVGLYIDTADFLRFFTAIFATALLLTAAYSDLKTRRIPNKLTVIVATVAIARLFVVNDLIFALATVVVAVLVFLITFLLFLQRIIGGGDAKLLTATVLLVGYHQLYLFFTIMAISGAMLSIMTLMIRSHRSFYFGAKLGSLMATSKPVPYGVAIATGAIATLFLKTSNIG